MRGQRLECTEQVPATRHAESQPALMLTRKIIPGIEQRIRQSLHDTFSLCRSHIGRQHSQAVERGDCAPQAIAMLITSAIKRIIS